MNKEKEIKRCLIETYLSTDREVSKKLKETEKKSRDVNFHSISAGSDNIILPRDYASFSRSYQVSGIGHMGLLLSIRVMRIVAECLKSKKDCEL